jgi:hypothetical protein
MIVPADAYLTRRYTNQPVGYRVLTLNRTVYAPFTQDRVLEDVPGHYLVVNGVDVPDKGGYIAWGIAGQDIISVSVEPNFLLPLAAQLDTLLAQITRQLGEARTASEIQIQVVGTRLVMLQDSQRGEIEQIKLLQQMMAGLVGLVERLDGLENVAHQIHTVALAAQHMEESGLASLLHLIERLDSVKRIGQRRLQTIGELEKFAEAMSNE